MINKRPICFIEDCNNGALLMLYNKYICGNCYMKIYRKQEQQKINEMQKFLKKIK